MQKLLKNVVTSEKEKINKGLKFIDDLRKDPKIIPFLEPEEIERLGLYDFRFINKKMTRLVIIEQNIKENRYNQFDQLIAQLKLNFQMFGYYVPLNDPLQNDINHFIDEIQKWKSKCDGTYVEQIPTQVLRNNNTVKTKEIQKQPKLFSNKNQKHYESQRIQKKKNYAAQQQQQKIKKFTKQYRLPVRSTLAQKLEMIYFLKSHQTNEPFIHNIGDKYGIGKDSQDQYVIKLDNSTCCAWLQILQNNQQTQ